MEAEYPVLIVGGGLVGLSTAIFLQDSGVRTLLVERHAGTAILPGVRVVSARSMELYREAGLEQAIRKAPPSVFVNRPQSSRRETLVGPEQFRAVRPLPGDSSDVSPCAPAYVDQDELEPLVRAHAERRGATVRFQTEMVSFRQDDEGVTASLLDRTTGTAHTVRSRYLVAADGHRSGIRRRLGIGLDGPGTLVHVLTIVFDADIDSLMGDGRLGLCYLNSPEPGTLLTPFNRSGGWILMVPYHPERGESVEDVSAADCRGMIRAAVGIPDLAVDILAPVADDPRQVLGWEIASRVAERYRLGRVFLAGDAAHVMPPAGGFGANTGVQDGHNLAWKMSMVLRGTAGETLLDSYETERRPVARRTCTESALRLRGRTDREGRGDAGRPVDQLSVSLGYSYRSPSVVAADHEPPPGFRAARDLSGEPGSRAPHVPLRRAGNVISTLDLFGRDPVVLAGPHGGSWLEAAAEVGERLGVTIRGVGVGTDVEDVDGQWGDRYAITPTGAVLVRPDGFVGWRAPHATANPAADLEKALRQILQR